MGPSNGEQGIAALAWMPSGLCHGQAARHGERSFEHCPPPFAFRGMTRPPGDLVGLDTSFVLRLLTGEPAPLAARASEELDALRAVGKKAVVSDLVVSEAYFALRYHYEVPKQLALDKLLEFLEDAEIVASGESLAVLRRPGLGKAKPGFVDRVIHAQYLRVASGMLTFEKSASKLPQAIVLQGNRGRRGMETGQE